MEQHYKNHVKLYVPHHFIFLPLTLALMIIGIIKAVSGSPEHQLAWGLFAVLSFCIFYLAVMLRQHYALGNQDRIVRLEFRLRYFQLYGESSSSVELQLSFGQIAALRFASDAEFKPLLARTLSERLSSKVIKQSIQHWQGDYMRV